MRCGATAFCMRTSRLGFVIKSSKLLICVVSSLPLSFLSFLPFEIAHRQIRACRRLPFPQRADNSRDSLAPYLAAPCHATRVPSCHHPITILSPAPLEDNAGGGEKAKLFKRTSFIVSHRMPPKGALSSLCTNRDAQRYSFQTFSNLSR